MAAHVDGPHTPPPPNQRRRHAEPVPPVIPVPPVPPAPPVIVPVNQQAEAIEYNMTLSLNLNKTYSQLAVLQITIPSPPTIDTPRICMHNWAHRYRHFLPHEQGESWVGECNKVGCKNVHVDHMHPGLITYESIRFQVVNHYSNKPVVVKALLALVEQQTTMFSPESERT
jgi:hypothetical protein